MYVYIYCLVTNLSIHASIYLYISIYQSIHPSIHPSTYESIYPSIYIYLSTTTSLLIFEQTSSSSEIASRKCLRRFLVLQSNKHMISIKNFGSFDDCMERPLLHVYLVHAFDSNFLRVSSLNAFGSVTSL